MKTIKNNTNEDTKNLLKYITHPNTIDNYATHDGIAMEPQAKISVINKLKEQGHKCLKSFESGPSY